MTHSCANSSPCLTSYYCRDSSSPCLISYHCRDSSSPCLTYYYCLDLLQVDAPMVMEQLLKAILPQGCVVHHVYQSDSPESPHGNESVAKEETQE